MKYHTVINKQLLYINGIFKLPAVGETKETVMENLINATTEVSNDSKQTVKLNDGKGLLQAVATDSDNNYIAVGHSFSSDGTLLWQRKLGGGYVRFFGVTTDSTNKYVAAGYESIAGNFEILIAKFNTNVIGTN